MRKCGLIRYHADIFLPEAYKAMMIDFVNTFDDIDLTNHAGEQMYEDKRGQIPLPTYGELLANENRLIELYEREDQPGCIQKIVIRVTGLHEKFDYSYVVARTGVIVTAWTNSKTDAHRLTESFNQYYCPSDQKDKIFKKICEESKNYKQIDNA